MTSMFSARNISRSYKVAGGFPAKRVQVLHKISFDLEAGQILAVVGESGSGKSTLARQLVMLEQPDSGELFLHGERLQSAAVAQQKIRLIFQNPSASLNPHKRIYQQLEEPLINFTALGRAERSDRIRLVLGKVGLDNAGAQRYPHMFSGGQRQRIAIARALMIEPEIIVADEAVSALDVSVQAQILNLILDLRDELDMSWLFITHDISVVKVTADRVMVLYAGRVMEIGSANEVLHNPLHPYTRKLLQSVPGSGSGFSADSRDAAYTSEVVSEGCVYRYSCPLADSVCELSEPPMDHVAGHSAACYKTGQG